MAKYLEPRRHLELEGAYNIRDVGGYATSDGRLTRWKTFLRADNLNNLTPGSQAALIEYGVRTVIDLRSTAGIQKEPNVFANSSAVAYYNHNMNGDEPLPDMPDFPEFTVPPDSSMKSYAKILKYRRPQIIETLATLASPGVLPALVHCWAGMGRTGVITALVLGLVGVPPEVIAEDFALSACFFVNRDSAGLPPPPGVTPRETVEEYRQHHCPPEGMFELLQHFEERYGGVEAYALDGGLTQERVDMLRSALIE